MVEGILMGNSVKITERMLISICSIVPEISNSCGNGVMIY